MVNVSCEIAVKVRCLCSIEGYSYVLVYHIHFPSKPNLVQFVQILM